MAKYVPKFDDKEIEFYKSAYIALAVHLIDPNMVTKVNLAGDPYWQARIDLADTIAMEMTGIFQITREIHEIGLVPE